MMGTMRRLLTVLVAACAALLLFTTPPAGAAPAPWFANQVGNATQVISVVGHRWFLTQRWMSAARGRGMGTDRGRHSGEDWCQGNVADIYEGSMQTPMGIFSLDFAFGTQPSPGADRTSR